MAQVSKYPISDKVYQRCWEIFIKTLIEIKNKSEADQIINDLLTPTERIMLAKRLAIAFLLTQGYEYRTISQLIRVSLPTIATVSLALKYGQGGYQEAIDRIVRDEKFRQQLNELAQKLISLPAKAGKGGGSWRYLKQELQKSSQKPF